jgi:hypothetical protein
MIPARESTKSVAEQGLLCPTDETKASRERL